jgi:hypothetical protein
LGAGGLTGVAIMEHGYRARHKAGWTEFSRLNGLSRQFPEEPQLDSRARLRQS